MNTKKNNLLIIKHPELLSEWDYEKNNANMINVNTITCGSHIKAWWKCGKFRGKYEMMVKDRVSGRGCPYCAGFNVLKGFNALQSCYPEMIASEWDWIKKNQIGLKPDEITYGSNRKAWWKCSHNNSHSWRASVKSRTGQKSGCPKCSHRISKQEDEVAGFIESHLCEHHADMKCSIYRSIKFRRIYEMNKINPDVVLSDDLQAHLLKEIDIYIPELSLAVEYDGDYWHDDEIMLNSRGMTNYEAHVIKQQLCSQAGIELLIITEHYWLYDTVNVKNMMMNAIHHSL